MNVALTQGKQKKRQKMQTYHCVSLSWSCLSISKDSSIITIQSSQNNLQIGIQFYINFLWTSKVDDMVLMFHSIPLFHSLSLSSIYPNKTGSSHYYSGEKYFLNVKGTLRRPKSQGGFRWSFPCLLGFTIIIDPFSPTKSTVPWLLVSPGRNGLTLQYTLILPVGTHRINNLSNWILP